MARGPKPQTAEQAKRRGDAGKRAKQKDAAEKAAGASDLPVAAGNTPPEYLEISDEARKIWAAIMPLLSTMTFVKVTDHGLLGRYCAHLARWIALNRNIEELGAVHYETQSLHGKMLRQHPDFAALMRIEYVLTSIEDRVGLSPSARQQLVMRAAGQGGSAGDKPPASPAGEQQPPAENEPDPTSLFARLRDAQPSGPAN